MRRVGRGPLADVDVEVGMIDVHARLDTGAAERREDRRCRVDVVLVTVEALVGREIEDERTVEDDRGRRESESCERFTRRGDPPARRHHDRDAPLLERTPGGDGRRVHLLAAGPQGSVEIGDDNLDVSHQHRACPLTGSGEERIVGASRVLRDVPERVGLVGARLGREAEDALAEDVALDLLGAAADADAPLAEEHLLPDTRPRTRRCR